MGIHPKIGITGLPRSGKSAVMEKVLKMLTEERTQEIKLRGNPTGKPINHHHTHFASIFALLPGSHY